MPENQHDGTILFDAVRLRFADDDVHGENLVTVELVNSRNLMVVHLLLLLVVNFPRDDSRQVA